MITNHSSSSNLKPIEDLIDSANKNELIVVIGSGVSMALTDGKNSALSWKGLIKNGFSYGVLKNEISDSQLQIWQGQLESEDIDDLLGAAEFMGRKLGAPSEHLYARWLTEVFNNIAPSNQEMIKAIIALHEAKIPICTLNYDKLLEKITNLPTIYMDETSKVTNWFRNGDSGILHLHGAWDKPESCILGIRDYENAVNSEIRSALQIALNIFKRFLFIGCGDTFADPNFSALKSWLNQKMKASTLQNYALVDQIQFATRSHDPSWHGFVEPICFGSEYTDLPFFIVTEITEKLNKDKYNPLLVEQDGCNTTKQLKLLDDYRCFLLKDCGQMTIEGVRADIHTAQRRFDIERLFVPLYLKLCPPNISECDPEREEKLKDWDNKHYLPFWEVFLKNERIALLGLPGSGKTLLLKRLAIAYSSSERRCASNDGLPDLDLMPILIRCREWRSYIKTPLISMLNKIDEITGQPSLTDFSKALIPLFKTGKILLLVDGLDEIHNDADRSIFVENLERFLEEFNLIRVVITSREAGFDLVAPSLARFCLSWRVSPICDGTIALLCNNWHTLMIGDTPEAKKESSEFSNLVLNNPSLRRLAENPLLLTMLLVVKHGAGRLPPDRVSLYERAVEVLLDTWNIKGHDALNVKESLPQLAYIAFELMKAGKQTATESELLKLLEYAQDNNDHIRRYARGTPVEFLKRVELRSSLLVEAGHQIENRRTVPFYQFRHLTFQEYLAAVAAVHGYYSGYFSGQTVNTPLNPFLINDEWKEVIPMAAVLARSQADPIMSALVRESRKLSADYLTNPYNQRFGVYPPPVALLLKCLIEEAEAAPQTIASALNIIAFFSRAVEPRNDLQILVVGPYGKDLLKQTWLLYSTMQWPKETLLFNTYCSFAMLRQPVIYWHSSTGKEELKRLLQSKVIEEITLGLFTCNAIIWDLSNNLSRDSCLNAWDLLGSSGFLFKDIESLLFHEDEGVLSAACWFFGLCIHRLNDCYKPSTEVLDRLLNIWVKCTNQLVKDRLSFAFLLLGNVSRDYWTPLLSHSEISALRENIKDCTDKEKYSYLASLLIFYHTKEYTDDNKLCRLIYDFYILKTSSHQPKINEPLIKMLNEIGDAGAVFLTKMN